MVKIRLTRQGAKKQPHYRIVVIDERKPRDGRPLKFLGTYDPRSNPERLDINVEQLESWIAKGAQLSPTVRTLVKRQRARASAAAS
jgi:small subunit ribosomal protein S16